MKNLRILTRKIFGREFTLWFAVITAALNLLVTFKLDYLSPEQAADIIALISAVFGVVAAWRTRPIAPQVFTYALSAAIALLGAYGLHFTQEQVGQWNFLVLAVVALITRNQVSPSEDAHRTGVLGNKAQ